MRRAAGAMIWGGLLIRYQPTVSPLRCWYICWYKNILFSREFNYISVLDRKSDSGPGTIPSFAAGTQRPSRAARLQHPADILNARRPWKGWPGLPWRPIHRTLSERVSASFRQACPAQAAGRP